MINKIKSFKNSLDKSKDGKVLVNNFSYLVLLQIASYVFPLLTMPYLARVIGVEGFGKIAFAGAVIIWFQTVVEWGFNYTATRDVARHRDDLDKVSEILSNVLCAKILLASISFLLLFFVTEIFSYLKNNQLLLLITFMLVPGKILFPDWFFQAMEKMRFITVFDLISKALFTMLTFLFVKQKSDFILQPLFLSFGSLIAGGGAFYIIIFKWRVKIYLPRWFEVRKTIENSRDIFINNLVPNLYNSFSLVLLGFISGSSANGLFDAGSRFLNITQQFLDIISRIFFPFLSRRSDKHSMYAKINISISIFFTIVLIVFAPFIIKIFFTPEFYQSIFILQIMACSLVFLALSNTYGLNYMIINGYEKILRNITIISSVIGFLISFPLIYFYSFLGAAITILLTRGILGLSIMYKAKKIQGGLLVE